MTRKAWLKWVLNGSESPRFTALCKAAVDAGGNHAAWKQFRELANRFKSQPDLAQFNPPGAGEWWYYDSDKAIRWNESTSDWTILNPAGCNAQQLPLKLFSFVLASILDGFESARSSIQFTVGRPRKPQSKNHRRDEKYRAYHRKYQLARYHARK